MISQSFIHELLNRVDIVDVIERDLPLKKGGANYAACCPFHSEKTPSFTVSPTKQFYHCFGCGAHGSAIGFVMEYNGMNFVEAVNDLAARIGLQVPVQQTESRSGAAESGSVQDKPQGGQNSSGDLLEVMNVAARFYREQLKHSKDAIMARLLPASALVMRRPVGETWMPYFPTLRQRHRKICWWSPGW